MLLSAINDRKSFKFGIYGIALTKCYLINLNLSMIGLKHMLKAKELLQDMLDKPVGYSSYQPGIVDAR